MLKQLIFYADSYIVLTPFNKEGLPTTTYARMLIIRSIGDKAA